MLLLMGFWGVPLIIFSIMVYLFNWGYKFAKLYKDEYGSVWPVSFLGLVAVMVVLFRDPLNLFSVRDFCVVALASIVLVLVKIRISNSGVSTKGYIIGCITQGIGLTVAFLSYWLVFSAIVLGLTFM